VVSFGYAGLPKPHASNNRSVVIINETVARKLWPGQNPIGRTALAGGTEPQVIGVIANVRESGAEDNAGPQMYLPATKQFRPEGANLVVRSKLPPTAVATSVMGTLRQINPGQPATEFKSIQGLVNRATSPRRFFVLLVGTFACFGTPSGFAGNLWCCLIFRYAPEAGDRHTHGSWYDRNAGATRCDLGDAAISADRHCPWNDGFACGRAPLIASLLFQTAPTDPLTFVGVVVLLGTVALLAGFLPARRASTIDPMVALRVN
jgi:hypothetical protein